MSENEEVTTQALIYISSKLGGRATYHQASKVMYFADKEHLRKMGRPIFDTFYRAMENGPVPSLAYDILKSLRGKGPLQNRGEEFSEFLDPIGSYSFTSHAEFDPDNFATLELDSINHAIDFCRGKDFKRLVEESHDSAWEKAGYNGVMDNVEMAKAAGSSDDVIVYLKDYLEINQSGFK